MTRAHARLLGPCFKTGPESTQSYSVADRSRSVREPRRQQSSEVGNGTGSDYRRASDALATSRTLTSSGLKPFGIPSSESTANTRVRKRKRREPQSTVSTSSLKPTPNGSRRPTRRKVHAFVAGSTYERRAQRRNVTCHAIARRLLRAANEFLPSTFRVSQVYP
ncbi:hypothetical protein GWI33_012443 [Rhynchophorus ferrugineus]|uniref:Uncharacterized protein n=1 Tax=Rhynchophorus ferrugineus TaxID=354439 RepID=A0A834I8W5_RHYFE|nr:hypothetical protein GWI33_012443 [Rhynchophorus ferrugineus]